MENSAASLMNQDSLPKTLNILNYQWSHYYFLLILLYPLVTAFLRHDRLHNTSKAFHYPTRRSFASMTDDDAFLIQQIIAELEFPFTFEKGLQFALFRTYGIPSISKLLVRTAQLSNSSTAPKRYVDTEVLIQEFTGHAPTSARTLEAISRMNYIHSVYQKSGLLLDDDMLYTLSLFAAEPMRWINRFEWRTLEDFEKCALGTFWKSIGDAMGIGYGGLKSGQTGWTDGLQWLEELIEWAEVYEKRCMVPDINNKKTAEETTALLLWHVPTAMKGIGKNLISALMDERLRIAMMYPAPPAFYFLLVATIFGTRKFLLRHLALPRPTYLRGHYLSTTISPHGTYHTTKSENAPYYRRRTLWARWKPAAWVTWARGLPLPGDDGDKYFPIGYRIEEVGPVQLRGKGADYGREMKEKLMGMRKGGCPFSR